MCVQFKIEIFEWSMSAQNTALQKPRCRGARPAPVWSNLKSHDSDCCQVINSQLVRHMCEKCWNSSWPH